MPDCWMAHVEFTPKSPYHNIYELTWLIPFWPIGTITGAYMHQTVLGYGASVTNYYNIFIHTFCYMKMVKHIKVCCLHSEKIL